MKYLDLGKNEKVSCIGIGCMRIAGMSSKEVDTLVKTALDEGINFFDHADIGVTCDWLETAKALLMKLRAE